METVELAAEPRTKRGKGASRQFRCTGQSPGRLLRPETAAMLLTLIMRRSSCRRSVRPGRIAPDPLPVRSDAGVSPT